MPELQHLQFEANLDEFTAVSASNGTIEHTTPGLNGTAGGVLYTATTGQASVYGRVTQALTGLSEFRMAWHVNLAAFTIGTDTHVANLSSPRAGTVGALGAVRIRRVSGALNIGFAPVNDGVSPSELNVPFVGLPAAMETWWTSESVDGAADGAGRLYFVGGDYAPGGELIAEFTGLDNILTFASVTNFRMGPQAIGTSSLGGSLVLDEMRLRDDATPILWSVEADDATGRRQNIAALRRRREIMCRRRTVRCPR